jgi:hypothetical protein
MSTTWYVYWFIHTHKVHQLEIEAIEPCVDDAAPISKWGDRQR